jgi:rhomboid protease GluP
MNFFDKVLRLLGTNRVQLAWRWRRFKEGWDKKDARPAATPRVGRVGSVTWGGLIPEEFPLISTLLVGLSVVFYFLTVKLTNDATGETGYTPSNLALVRYGAVYTPLLTEGGEWWRLVSSIFLHANGTHILMNGLGLWTVGNAVEQHFGRARALVVFVVAGAAGMAASVWWRPVVLVVGASGGIFGLMGCLIAHAVRFKATATGRELKARFVPWLIYGLILGFAVPGVDNAAHIGGLVAGAAVGWFLGEQRTARRVRGVWEGLAFATAVVVAASFVLAVRSPFVPG